MHRLTYILLCLCLGTLAFSQEMSPAGSNNSETRQSQYRSRFANRNRGATSFGRAQPRQAQSRIDLRQAASQPRSVQRAQRRKPDEATPRNQRIQSRRLPQGLRAISRRPNPPTRRQRPSPQNMRRRPSQNQMRVQQNQNLRRLQPDTRTNHILQKELSISGQNNIEPKAQQLLGQSNPRSRPDFRTMRLPPNVKSIPAQSNQKSEQQPTRVLQRVQRLRDPNLGSVRSQQKPQPKSDRPDLKPVRILMAPQSMKVQTEPQSKPFQEKTHTSSIQPDAQRMQVQGKSQSMRVQSDQEPNQVQTNSQPIQFNTNARPMQVNTNSRPMQVQTNSRSMQAQTNSRLIQVRANSQPIQVQADSRPMQVQTNLRPIQVQTKAKNTRVQPDQQLMQVQANSQPTPGQSNQQSMRRVHLDQLASQTIQSDLQDQANLQPLRVQPDQQSMQVQSNSQPMPTQLDQQTTRIQPEQEPARAQPDQQTIADSQSKRVQTDFRTMQTRTKFQSTHSQPDQQPMQGQTNSQSMRAQPDQQSVQAKATSQQMHNQPDQQPMQGKSQPMLTRPDQQSVQSQANSQPMRAQPDQQVLQSQANLHPMVPQPDQQMLQSHANSQPMFPHLDQQMLQSHAKSQPMLLLPEQQVMQSQTNSTPISPQPDQQTVQSQENLQPMFSQQDQHGVQFQANSQPLLPLKDQQPLKSQVSSQPILPLPDQQAQKSQANSQPILPLPDQQATGMEQNQQPTQFQEIAQVWLPLPDQQAIQSQANPQLMPAEPYQQATRIQLNQQLKQVQANSQSLRVQSDHLATQAETNTQSMSPQQDQQQMQVKVNSQTVFDQPEQQVMPTLESSQPMRVQQEQEAARFLSQQKAMEIQPNLKPTHTETRQQMVPAQANLQPIRLTPDQQPTHLMPDQQPTSPTPNQQPIRLTPDQQPIRHMPDQHAMKAQVTSEQIRVQSEKKAMRPQSHQNDMQKTQTAHVQTQQQTTQTQAKPKSTPHVSSVPQTMQMRGQLHSQSNLDQQDLQQVLVPTDQKSLPVDQSRQSMHIEATSRSEALSGQDSYIIPGQSENQVIYYQQQRANGDQHQNTRDTYYIITQESEIPVTSKETSNATINTQSPVHTQATTSLHIQAANKATITNHTSADNHNAVTIKTTKNQAEAAVRSSTNYQAPRSTKTTQTEVKAKVQAPSSNKSHSKDAVRATNKNQVVSEILATVNSVLDNTKGMTNKQTTINIPSTSFNNLPHVNQTPSSQITAGDKLPHATTQSNVQTGGYVDPLASYIRHKYLAELELPAHMTMGIQNSFRTGTFNEALGNPLLPLSSSQTVPSSSTSGQSMSAGSLIDPLLAMRIAEAMEIPFEAQLSNTVQPGTTSAQVDRRMTQVVNGMDMTGRSQQDRLNAMRMSEAMELPALAHSKVNPIQLGSNNPPIDPFTTGNVSSNIRQSTSTGSQQDRFLAMRMAEAMELPPSVHHMLNPSQLGGTNPQADLLMTGAVSNNIGQSTSTGSQQDRFLAMRMAKEMELPPSVHHMLNPTHLGGTNPPADHLMTGTVSSNTGQSTSTSSQQDRFLAMRMAEAMELPPSVHHMLNPTQLGGTNPPADHLMTGTVSSNTGQSTSTSSQQDRFLAMRMAKEMELPPSVHHMLNPTQLGGTNPPADHLMTGTVSSNTGQSTSTSSQQDRFLAMRMAKEMEFPPSAHHMLNPTQLGGTNPPADHLMTGTVSSNTGQSTSTGSQQDRFLAMRMAKEMELPPSAHHMLNPTHFGGTNPPADLLMTGAVSNNIGQSTSTGSQQDRFLAMRMAEAMELPPSAHHMLNPTQLRGISPPADPLMTRNVSNNIGQSTSTGSQQDHFLAMRMAEAMELPLSALSILNPTELGSTSAPGDSLNIPTGMNNRAQLNTGGSQQERFLAMRIAEAMDIPPSANLLSNSAQSTSNNALVNPHTAVASGFSNRGMSNTASSQYDLLLAKQMTEAMELPLSARQIAHSTQPTSNNAPMDPRRKTAAGGLNNGGQSSTAGSLYGPFPTMSMAEAMDLPQSEREMLNFAKPRANTAPIDPLVSTSGNSNSGQSNSAGSLQDRSLAMHKSKAIDLPTSVQSTLHLVQPTSNNSPVNPLEEPTATRNSVQSNTAASQYEPYLQLAMRMVESMNHRPSISQKSNSAKFGGSNGQVDPRWTFGVTTTDLGTSGQASSQQDSPYGMTEAMGLPAFAKRLIHSAQTTANNAGVDSLMSGAGMSIRGQSNSASSQYEPFLAMRISEPMDPQTQSYSGASAWY